MPGTTFTFVSAGQYDAAGDVFGVTPAQAPVTFTKEVVLLGSCFVDSGSPGTFNIFTADAPTALIACYGRYVVAGSGTGQIVTAIGSTALQSATTVATSTFNLFGSTDVLISAGLNTGSARLQQLQAGDAFGFRQSTLGFALPVGVITLVLQRF